MSEQRRSTSSLFCFKSDRRERPERPRASSVPASPSAAFQPDIAPARKRRAAGFTMIELMIAVAVVGILAAIAYPSYLEHMRKTRRAAAQTFISDIATRQQQYLIDARAYAGGAGALAALNLMVPSDVSRFYTVTIGPAAPTVPPSYTITATPVAGSAQAPDGALTLDNLGTKTRNGQQGW